MAALDQWKDNHESSNDSEKENDMPADPNYAAAAGVVKAALYALKAETKLQSFSDTLMKLDQKLIEDCNAHKCDAEDAARSLK